MVTLLFMAWFVVAFQLAALKVMAAMAGIYAGLKMSVVVAKIYDDNSARF